MQIVSTSQWEGQDYEIIGLESASIVKTRNCFSKWLSSWRTIVDGNVNGQESLYDEMRKEIIEKLSAKANERGADAIIALRIDINEITMFEAIAVTAYGTLIKFKS